VVSVEERVGFLDGTVKGHSKMIDGVREAVTNLEQRMDRRLDRLDLRLDALDAKMSRQFHWLVGILLSAMIAMLGMMGGVLSVALRR
jgi:hypothetical protein